MPRYIDADAIVELKGAACKAATGLDLKKLLDDYAPTVDAEPVRHGRWIYCEDDSGQDGIVCSLCGHFVPWYYDYYESSDDLIKDNIKCPHCGAKMDGDDE